MASPLLLASTIGTMMPEFDNPLWIAVAVLVLVAIFAGIAEYRRGRRRDLDRIGLIYWPTVQILALMGALGCAVFALMGGG